MNGNIGSSSLKELFCYFHVDGKFVTDVEGQVRYHGGRVNVETIKAGMTLEDLKAIISRFSGYDGRICDIKYTVKYDERTLIDLVDDGGITNIFGHNDIIAHVYVSLKRDGSQRHEINDSQITEIEHVLGLSDQERVVSPLTLENDYGHLSQENTIDCLTYDDDDGGISREDYGAVDEGLSFRGGNAMSPRTGMNYVKWSGLFSGLGQRIAHADLFREYLYKFSIAHNFKYKFLRNSKEKMSVKCSVEGCPWKLCANAVGNNCPYLRVTTFINEHFHSGQDNLQVGHGGSSTWTSRIIIDEVRNHCEKRPTEIMKTLQAEYGVNLTYKQAYRAKEKAMEDIHGRPEQSYMLIPWLCERLKETDDKTVAEWVAGPNNTFERVFIAYGCCIEGFLGGARRILYVDGTHLSGPYKGTLLAASAYDANNEMLPFAIAIVQGETLDDWSWFMHMIKNVVGSVPLTIVSDRHNAIIGAVQSIFGSDRHAYCYRHVRENFSAEWLKVNKGKRNRTRSKDDALMLLDNIAWARGDDEFDKAMAEMRSFSQHLFDWLNNHGDLHKWAVSKFPYKRWDNITTNIAESFNSWMVKERKHNVVQMIHEHREKVAKKMHASSVKMTKWKTCIGPKIETILKENVAISERFFAENYGGGRVNVHTPRGHHRVDLRLHHCSCGEWQMRGIPCRHACAAVKVVHGNIYDYVEECYKVSSQEKIYGRCMIPVVTIDMPNINDYRMENISGQTFLQPPITSRPPGRPRTVRRESQSQNKKIYHCTQCHEVGHTRRTCKNPNPC